MSKSSKLEDITPEYCLVYHQKFSSPYPNSTTYRCEGFYNPVDITSVEYYPETDRYALYFGNGKYIFITSKDFAQYADWLKSNPIRIEQVHSNGKHVVAKLTDGRFAVHKDGEWEPLDKFID